MTLPGGALTISLDFELFWGMRDHRTLDAYGPAILGGRQAVTPLLELFRRYEIHATWAAVGMTFFENRAELERGLPARRPAYADKHLDPYAGIGALGVDEAADPYHFAGSLLRQIAATPGQEVATHTFSHFYCLEAGQNEADFRADLAAARLAQESKLGSVPRSLVFPRNQCNPAYLAVCAEAGLVAYRGNPRSWVYEPRARGEETLPQRAVRLLDSYVNLTGHHGHALPAAAAGTEAAITPIDVPASRFLRPVSRRLRRFEGLRLARIRRDLDHCAARGLLYHLWWHPENFGARTAENLEFLEAVLKHFARLRAKHGMRSLSMQEVAARG